MMTRDARSLFIIAALAALSAASATSRDFSFYASGPFSDFASFPLLHVALRDFR